MMVMFLTGLVAIILMRTLRKDFARCVRVRQCKPLNAIDRYHQPAAPLHMGLRFSAGGR